MDKDERKIARRVWQAGYSAGAEDSTRRLAWANRTRQSPYDAGPLPELTPNPYDGSDD